MPKAENLSANKTVDPSDEKSAPQHFQTPGEFAWPVEMLPTNELKPAKRKARVHSKRKIQILGESMLRFGLMAPLIVDNSGRLVAGHARHEAAQLVGLKFVPVIRATHLSETELRAFALADNKIASTAGWDRDVLSEEFRELQIALPEVGLDLEITGFEIAEIDTIIVDHDSDKVDPTDDLPEQNGCAVSKPDEVFILGSHRLVVGDARNEDVYAKLMRSEKATMAFLDVPYNVPVNGHVGGRGRTKHREFSFASGEMSPQQFVIFLKDAFGHCARTMVDGGISYICIDWRHVGELLEAGSAAYDELKNICVWTKTTPGQGSFYRSQHEFVFVYKTGSARHINTFELGQHGRNRSNVWSYPGVNMFRAGRMDELKMHPTVKPVAMVADAMRDCSRRGSIILDAFAGSGTTIMAAEKIGRRAFCVEIDPLYVDTAIRRWQAYTGKDAVLESTGQTFGQLQTSRQTGIAKSLGVKSVSDQGSKK